MMPTMSRSIFLLIGWLAVPLSVNVLADDAVNSEGPVEERAGDESEYYRIVSVFTPESSVASRSKQWKPAPKGLALEVSGMCVLDDGRVAVAIRKGEIWILDGVFDDPPKNVSYQQFASALHDPRDCVGITTPFIPSSAAR